MVKISSLGHIFHRLKWGEDALAIFIFSAMTILPFFESFSRFLNINSVPASQILVQHFTLWIGLLGGVLAARQNKLLALTRDSLFKKDKEIVFEAVKQYGDTLEYADDTFKKKQRNCFRSCKK